MKKNISTIHIRSSADVSRKLGVSFDLAKTVVTNKGNWFVAGSNKIKITTAPDDDSMRESFPLIGHVWHQGANYENEVAA